MLHEYRPPSPEILQWIGREAGGRVVSVSRLRGGITADMDRITVDASTGPRDVVLRRWPHGAEWDGLVSSEVAALCTSVGHDVPVPRMLAFDETGAASGARCTLTTALPGRPDLAPVDPASWLEQLATTQAAIHAVPGPGGGASASPDRYGERDRSLAWLADRGLRGAAREAASQPAVGGGSEAVLIHGDYQHFNVLWVGATLTGVVDWPTATTGARGTDVGHCRLNLAVLFDARTAEDYLTRYERAAGTRIDRRDDLRALLCFDLDWLEFIPHQVAGRADLELAGMPDRVADVVRLAVDAID